MRRSLKNPVYLFLVIWLFVLFLYKLKLSNVLLSLLPITENYVLYTSIAFAFPGLILTFLLLEGKTIETKFFLSLRYYYKLRRLFKFWLICTVIEILFFGIFPLFSFIGIRTLSYTEWGFKGFHGFLNAIILVISNLCFYRFISERKKKYLILFVLCLMWPILLVTRQMFMSMIIQAILIYLYTKRIKIKNIFKVSIVFLGVIYVFGLLGDLRSGTDSFFYLASPTSNYPLFLPSGFLWLYIYLTSPLNNINYNILSYTNFNFSLNNIIAQLVPSFLRNKVFTQSGNEFKLVNEFLNVGSAHTTFLSAFGYNGAVIVFLLMGTICTLIYFKTLKKKCNVKWVFILIVFAHNILMSVFVDFFTNLVFLSQIFLHFYLGTTISDFNKGRNEI